MHTKRNHKQVEKTTHRMGENTWEQCDQQEINLQNLQKTRVFQYQKNKKKKTKNRQKI